MKKIVIISSIFLSTLTFCVAQDIHFSMFNFAPLTLNPAQAGVQCDVRAIGNYRSQWGSIAKPYSTFGVGADMSLFKKPSMPAWLGAGVNIYNDKAGDGQMGTFMANMSVAGVVKSEKSLFSAGLQFGYNQKSVNTDNLTWDNQFNGFKYDPALPDYEYFTNRSFHYFDMAGGINWYYTKTEHYMSANDEVKANIGLSVFHFNKAHYSFKDFNDERLYSKLVFHGNFGFGVHSARTVICPSYVIYKQGPSYQVNVGNLFKYIITEASHFTHVKKACAVSLGGFYRLGDAFIGQMVFEYDRYALGFAYDMNLSKLKTASKSFGGFEVNFRWNTFRGALTTSRI